MYIIIQTDSILNKFYFVKITQYQALNDYIVIAKIAGQSIKIETR